MRCMSQQRFGICLTGDISLSICYCTNSLDAIEMPIIIDPGKLNRLEFTGVELHRMPVIEWPVLSTSH